MTEHTIRWIEFDDPNDPPIVEHRNDYGEVERFDPDYSRVPSLPVWQQALARVMGSVDEATCDLSDCTNSIGYVLHEYEDDHGRETGRTEFREFALVAVPRGVVAVCEDCTPTNLYESAIP